MKRTLALLMALLLFLTSTAPTAKVFAQGEVPETGGTATYQTILKAPNPTVEKGKEGTLPSNGGDIHILYNSHNVKDTDMEVQVLKDDVLMPYTFTTVLAHDDQGMHGVEFSGKLPANDRAKDVVYKFYIKEKADEKYDASNVITITVKAKNTAEPTITGVNRTDIVLEPDSPSRYVTLTFEGNNLSSDTVKAVTKKDGVVTDEIKWNYLSIAGFMASTIMPAAPEDKDIVYTTTFSTANGSKQTVKITVKAKSAAAPTEKTLTGISIEPTSLPKSGGDVVVTLKGENLEPADINSEIRIRMDLQNIPVKWEKTTEGLKANLTIPENTSGAEQKYLMKFFLKNDTSKFQKGNVTVTLEEGPVAPAVPTVKDLIADPVSLPTTGGDVALIVTAENATKDDIQWTVKKRRPRRSSFKTDLYR